MSQFLFDFFTCLFDFFVGHVDPWFLSHSLVLDVPIDLVYAFNPLQRDLVSIDRSVNLHHHVVDDVHTILVVSSVLSKSFLEIDDLLLLVVSDAILDLTKGLIDLFV